ncbi:hypothetical protein AFL01nite_20220 [Aeromicrobium flavum]|uniref:Fis family transcriptional regulator n=1 Tax=Aeromicrobium flavum TaxID=416568 RepID=A0A512HW85_9ACTN|nr:hypothetical protein [Aeromicrobium flavum]GEO89695.1 hypothetical protein AFL01nite_20220 [Aeromicrobium flavum]
MRWDRLFADLEGVAADAHAEERDALAEDLRDEQWASLSWTDLLGGPDVRLDVAGLGEVGGRVVGVGDVLLVEDAGRRLVVLPEAVTAVVGTDGRAAPAAATTRTRRQLARALRDAGAPVRVVRRDGRAVEGTIVAAGADFVQVAAGDRRVSLPWAWIAALVER